MAESTKKTITTKPVKNSAPQTTTKVEVPAVKKAVANKILSKVEGKAVTPIIAAPVISEVLSGVEGKPIVAKYLNKNIMISPRKLRLLVNNIKKLSPAEALVRLKFTNTKAARVMIKVLQNVISDAKANFNLDTNTLKFDLVKVDEGLKIKRMDKSHGSRFARGLIQKRHSRLVIHVKGIQK